MQAREDRVKIRTLKEAESTAIKRFLVQLGAPNLIDLDKTIALEIKGGSYSDVFEVGNKLRGLTSVLARSPYAMGFYVGSIDLKTYFFKPSLPLAVRACRLCRLKIIHCFIIKCTREAMRFTYGKNVRAEFVASWEEGIKPVLSKDGDCLGWGVLVARGSVKYLRPIRDLGWYLRRGG